MKFILFFFLLILTHLAIAQKKHWINEAEQDVKKDLATNYYTLSKTDVKTYIYKKYVKSTDSLIEVINFPTKERTTKEGNYERYFSNGKLAEQGDFLNNLKTGVWKFYRKNGSLNKTITFCLGVKEGRQTDYYKNGKIEAVYRYKIGELNSLIEIFNEEGILIFREDTSDAAVYTFTDQEAIFPNGSIGLKLFLKENRTGFKNAKTKVYVSFNINKKGTVTEIEINKLTNKNRSDKELKESLQLIAKMPQWEPAMKRGRVVKSSRLIKIEF